MSILPELAHPVGVNAGRGALATLMSTVAVFSVVGDALPPVYLYVWVAFQIVISATRWRTGRHLINAAEAGAELDRRVTIYASVMTLSGLGWGVASVMVAVYASMEWQLFVLAIILGIVSGGVATIGPLFTTYSVFTAGSMGMQVLAFALGGTTMHYIMAFLTLLYIGVVLQAGRVLRDWIIRSVELTRQLEVAKEEADEANLAKSRFLSSMSHELRTPLHAIMGFNQLLSVGGGLNEDQKENVNEISRSTDHLLGLINEVLDLARIESGSVEVTLIRVDLCDVVGQVLTSVGPMAKKHGVSLQAAHPDGPALVQSDATRLKQVLLNLVSNAIKYNRPGGAVSLSCLVKDDGGIRVQVADTGYGIPQALQKNMFKPFNRLGRESGSVEGTGIGLVITRELVKLLHGEMGFESTEGVGSVFWVALPGFPVGGEAPEVVQGGEL